MFKISNLHASADNNEILNGISLQIPTGEMHVLMGPNGSGKSTLSKVIMGHPSYTITKGSVVINQDDILNLDVSERSKKGIFLAFQYPQEIPGVNFSNYMRLVYNAHQSKENQLPVFKFRKLIKQKAKELEISESLIQRNLNEDLSGGEKKKLEILQMALIEPKLAILDETDSGLDLDALKTIFSSVTKLQKSIPEMSILIITHYQRIFEYINPNKIHVMLNGKIHTSGGMEVIEKINKDGYKQFNDEG